MAENDTAGRLPYRIDRIGIIGLGLIGGSLARALRLRAGAAVVGLDRDISTITRALADGILTAGAQLPLLHDAEAPLSDEAKKSFSLLSDCDLVIICTPVEFIPMYVDLAARFSSGLITDVASVKQPVMQKVACERFIGGHPMAGSERQGYNYSSESLFENAIYVLCLQENSNLPVSKVKALEELITRTGAAPMHMKAREHDRAVAAVSHLPHVAASALSVMAARLDDGNLARLAAGGFRDITRIASSDPDLWAGICRQSGVELAELLEKTINLLQEFHQSLVDDDIDSMRRFFFQGAKYRDGLPVDGRGALISPSSLTVYLNDQPGELGRVAALLGEEGINIRNIRIREYRAYEGGCLQLLLPDSAQTVKAAWILREAGYACD